MLLLLENRVTKPGLVGSAHNDCYYISCIQQQFHCDHLIIRVGGIGRRHHDRVVRDRMELGLVMLWSGVNLHGCLADSLNE